jgi:hypothetical protein
MSGRFQGGRAVHGNVGQSPILLFGPALTFSLWEPFFAGALKANAQAQEVFAMIAGEWQTFLARRLQEDIALMQRLAGSRAPEQILAAHAAFWQTAAEDYGKELTTIGKLAAKVTSKVAQVSQAARDEANRDQWHRQRVAA